MPRVVPIVILAIVLAVASASQAAGAQGGARPAGTAPQPRPVLVAFRGSFHLGGYRSRGFGGYGRSRPRSSLLHRAVKTAIWLYILHLFFSHGGLSVLLWIVIIGLLLSLVRRRRRYASGPQSSWR